MRIIEKGCDPSIKLAKFKFNCDECDKSIPNPLPQNLNHFMMIVGKPGWCIHPRLASIFFHLSLEIAIQ